MNTCRASKTILLLFCAWIPLNSAMAQESNKSDLAVLTPDKLPFMDVTLPANVDGQPVRYDLYHLGEGRVRVEARIDSKPPINITRLANFLVRQAGDPGRPVDYGQYAQALANAAATGQLGGAGGLAFFPWSDFVARVSEWVRCCSGDVVVPITGPQNYIGSHRSGGRWINLGGIGPLDTRPLSDFDRCARVHDAEFWLSLQFLPGAHVYIHSTIGNAEGDGDIDYRVPEDSESINREVIDCFKKALASRNSEEALSKVGALGVLSKALEVVTTQYDGNLEEGSGPGIVLLTTPRWSPGSASQSRQEPLAIGQ